MRGNANHKLGKLHFVRGTTEEAANTCEINHSDYMQTESEGGIYLTKGISPPRGICHISTVQKWIWCLHALEKAMI